MLKNTMNKLKLRSHFVIIPTVILAALVGLSGCENMKNQDSGALLGGATGALAGAQFGGGSGKLYTTAAGAILGAILGSSVGSRLDEADKIRAEQAYSRAASSPVGNNISWSNPHLGHHGSVRTVREGRSSYGEYCREFQSTTYLDGYRETVYSTACRSGDGRWHAM